MLTAGIFCGVFGAWGGIMSDNSYKLFWLGFALGALLGLGLYLLSV